MRAYSTLCVFLIACTGQVDRGPSGPVAEEDAAVPSDGAVEAGPSADAQVADSAQSPSEAGIPHGMPDAATQPNCTGVEETARDVLQVFCARCHSGVKAQGGFAAALDAEELLDKGYIRPYDLASSAYARMANGTMPPVSETLRPSSADIQNVSDWVLCGGTPWSATEIDFSFVDIDTRISVILADLRAELNPVVRQRYRYFDLSHLANAGVSADQIEVYRQALFFAVNSLSTGTIVARPIPVDEQDLIYRIDLRDYGWGADTWAILERVYPYAVLYNQDSLLFAFNEIAAQQIRDETDSTIPYIQVDWFLSHATRPPIYNEILNIPLTLAELQGQVGVNIAADIAAADVTRSGFSDAGPSQNNRVIERHNLAGGRGAFWISYDFKDNLGDHDIFANPLDFREDGGEVIINLVNGLQFYFITNAAGIRQDKAPNNVVQDPLSRDGAVETGISCMNCHGVSGILPKFDEVANHVRDTAANAAEIEAVLRLYGSQARLAAAFEGDRTRYVTAMSRLGITRLTTQTLHQFDGAHQGLINLRVAAAVLGISVADLTQSLDSAAIAFPPEIATLRRQGGQIQRDTFEQIFPVLVEVMGFGRALGLTLE